MSTQRIQPALRTAIWVGYDKKCLYCRQPILFDDMHVDHFIPESINPQTLQDLKKSNLVPGCYNVRGDYNLVASCVTHNSMKSNDLVPELAIPLYLNKMRRHIVKVKDHLVRLKKDNDYATAITVISQLIEEGVADPVKAVEAIRNACEARDKHTLSFLGVSLPENILRIKVASNVQHLFDVREIDYYKVFTEVANVRPDKIEMLPGGLFMLRISESERIIYRIRDYGVYIMGYKRKIF